MVIRILFPIFFMLLMFLNFKVDCSLSYSSSFLSSSTHLCLSDQRAALLEFKNTISLDDYCGQSPINSWNESSDCCSWDGVSCNNLTGHVIAIDLSDNCLNASILANSSLFHLQDLQRLDLTSSSLRFDAHGFDMLGRNLTKLTDLVLDHVDMSGVSVTSFLNLSSSMESLRLSSCQLHGEFPSQVFSLPNLKHVDLSANEYLTGYLPKTNLSRALEVLNLYNCRFTGSIPASFGNLTQINFIDFTQNDFAGQIPDVFQNLNNLTILKFYSCNFSGQAPRTVFNLAQITQLDLSHNQLEGSLPNHVTQLQFLEDFSLSNNLITGGVPSWLFSLPSLRILDLSYNKLTGPIDQTQKPNSILAIDLSSNDIHGPIPSSLFELANLTVLRLSSNNLSGVIESNMLSKLISLYELDLSHNSLLSLSNSGNGGNYSFPELAKVSFASCSITEFPSFFRTSNLEILDLSNNNISGGISKWEAEGWEGLHMLNLSHNFLTSLEQFPGKNLQILDLHSNLLQGPILSTCLYLQTPYPPKVSFFLISDNKLTGNVPSLICNWTSLVVLDLSKNSLSGTIPECLGNFRGDLQFINLQRNNFHGEIPDSFTNKRLTNLLLNDNQLEGSLPRSMANCTSLKVLNLGNNKLTDTFPHWLASLPSLQVLILRFNRFHGSISNSMASTNFSALQIIDFSRNELTGTLPTNLFRNLRAMKDVPRDRNPLIFLPEVDGFFRYFFDYCQGPVNVTMKRLELEFVKNLYILAAMDFSNNLFSGQIPAELGELISLQVLNLSRNNFTGPIPPSFGNLVALESLDLSSNKLDGIIPSELTNLTFLEVLDLSKNDLVGPIPKGKQFDTFDNVSYIDNSGLCGLPLSKQCSNLDGPAPEAPMATEDEGSEIPFIWKVAMMGYGCGVVLGISFGYIVMTTGKPWWLVRIIKRDLQNKVTKWINRRN